MSANTLIVPNADTPLDLVIWLAAGRRYVEGLVEATYAQNRGLADPGPYLPALTSVAFTPPPPGPPAPVAIVRLY